GVASVTRHPAYREGDAIEGDGDIAGDLALARLDPPVTPTRLVRPICLPGPAVRFPPGTNCTVTGWGDIRTAGQCHRGTLGSTPGGWGQVGD
ncbi:PRSS8 protein, partial [Alca torda]|nr:PRSS8 protein [Alca torda]